MRLQRIFCGTVLVILSALRGHECSLCETCVCSNEADSTRAVNCEGKRLEGTNTLRFDLLMFDEDPRLNSLNLAGNEIPAIPIDMFRNLKDLKYLNLSNNYIESIPSFAFNDLESLLGVDFSSNKLSALPSVTLNAVNTLERMNLRRNSLEELDSTIGEFAKLIWLDVSRNNLTSLYAKSLENLTELRYLDLSFNGIKTLDNNDLSLLVHLKSLILNNNNLMHVNAFPDSVTRLSLGDNSITLIPRALTNLRVLDMERNGISNISELPFDQLESLNLSGNELTDFPNAKLDQLTILDLSFNKLNVVPESVRSENLAKLRTLVISGNPIRKLNFASELRLERLFASYLDSFESIDEDSFENLASIEPGACLNLTISGNKRLATIDENALANLKVCSLDLSGNNLESISPTLIKPLSDTSANYSIDLQGNPFHCDCSLQWMLADLVPKLYTMNQDLLIDLRCASPPSLENQRLVHWYKWEERVFCENSSILLSKMSVQPASVMSRSGGTIKIESSMGMLAAVIGAVVVLSMLVTIGIVMARRIALKRSRKNRRF